MSEDAVASTSVVLSPKKSKTKSSAAAGKSKSKSKSSSSHPKVTDMVNAALAAPKQRNGSSVQAINKYMVVTYIVDAEKMAPFVKKYRKTAVASGLLVQTKGKGACGSIKLGPSAKEKEKVAPKKGTKEKAKKTNVAVKKSSPKKSPPKTVKKLEKKTSTPKPKQAKAASSPAKKKPSAKPVKKPKPSTNKAKKPTKKTTPKKQK